MKFDFSYSGLSRPHLCFRASSRSDGTVVETVPIQKPMTEVTARVSPTPLSAIRSDAYATTAYRDIVSAGLQCECADRCVKAF
jgi:hypothetical protein